MANVREEILDIKITLGQICEEKSDLLKALRVQEDNFSYYFRIYQDKVEVLLKEKDDKFDLLLRENCQLNARIRGDKCCNTGIKFWVWNHFCLKCHFSTFVFKFCFVLQFKFWKFTVISPWQISSGRFQLTL